MWRARFWSVLIFFIFGIKTKKINTKNTIFEKVDSKDGDISETGKSLEMLENKNYKKFCLSFYVCENYQNIEKLKINSQDYYLSYWIAHLIPIYQEDHIHSNFLLQNSWIRNILPNHDLNHHIDIGLETWTKIGFFKKIIEKLLNNKIGNILQIFLKYLWLPILIYKKNKLGKNSKNIVISDNILKFYQDKRVLYNKIISG